MGQATQAQIKEKGRREKENDTNWVNKARVRKEITNKRTGCDAQRREVAALYLNETKKKYEKEKIMRGKKGRLKNGEGRAQRLWQQGTGGANNW